METDVSGIQYFKNGIIPNDIYCLFQIRESKKEENEGKEEGKIKLKRREFR